MDFFGGSILHIKFPICKYERQQVENLLSSSGKHFSNAEAKQPQLLILKCCLEQKMLLFI